MSDQHFELGEKYLGNFLNDSEKFVTFVLHQRRTNGLIATNLLLRRPRARGEEKGRGFLLLLHVASSQNPKQQITRIRPRAQSVGVDALTSHSSVKYIRRLLFRSKKGV
jgi:hypothetical protein